MDREKLSPLYYFPRGIFAFSVYRRLRHWKSIKPVRGFAAISFRLLFLTVFFMNTLAVTQGGCQGGKEFERVTMERTAQNTLPSFKETVKGGPSGPKGGFLPQPVENERGRILVYIRMTDVSNHSLDELRAYGVDIKHVAEKYKTVTAYMYPDRIADLKNLDKVLNVREVEKPLLNIDSGKIRNRGPGGPPK